MKTENHKQEKDGGIHKSIQAQTVWEWLFLAIQEKLTVSSNFMYILEKTHD